MVLSGAGGETTKFLVIMALVIAGGALGGLAFFLFALGFSESRTTVDGKEVRGRHLFWCAASQIGVGLCGAVAVQFLLILIRIFPKDPTSENAVLLVSVSAAAGFGARRLLPSLASNLERRVEQAEIQAERAQEGAEQAKDKATRAEVMSKVSAALRPGTTESQRAEAIEQLRDLTRSYPTQRSYAIMLGRLLRDGDDLDGAIATLEHFINAKGLISERDKDVADAYYNKACYHSLIFGKSRSASARDSALEALAFSISLSSENRIDAEHDTDFSSIREEKAFGSLVNGNGRP